jgi:hypothetical protein
MSKFMPVWRATSAGAAALALMFSLGCASAGDSTCAAGLACTGDAQTPATGALANIDAWLVKEEFARWKCEPKATGASRDDAHGANRVCSNNLMSASANGDFPVGAANVKELFDSNGVRKGFAFAVKVKAGRAEDTWYWYEKIGSRIVANGVSDSTCTGCHSKSPRDYVYVRVP